MLLVSFGHGGNCIFVTGNMELKIEMWQLLVQIISMSLHRNPEEV